MVGPKGSAGDEWRRGPRAPTLRVMREPLHGTVERFLAPIMAEGLKKGKRHHVHLSKDMDTARKVGARRGKPVILQVDGARMQSQGYKFFVSANGVWLTDAVPAEFLTRL